MTTLTKGANCPLGVSSLTFSVALGSPAALAAVVDGDPGPTLVHGGAPLGPGVELRGECIDVDLNGVPADTTVRLVATLLVPGATFGALAAPVARLESPGAGVEFVMTGLSSETSVVGFELYRRNEAWKVRAVGQGYAGGLRALLDDHGIAVPEAATPRRPRPYVERHPLWDLVERPAAGARAARPVSWKPGARDFTYVDSIRNLLPGLDELPPGTQKFAVAESWAGELRRLRGSGFESSWRDGRDHRMSPNWAALTSVVLHQASGRLVAAGRMTDENWGLSPAYDSGTSGVFEREGHADQLLWPNDILYVGSTRTGVLVPIDARSNLCSVDLDPASGTIAVVESLGSVGCLTVYDGPRAKRRRLSVLERHAGNEQVRFSPDGRWLLVSRHDGTYLCEVATGRMVTLTLTNCVWWPMADSMLLEIAEIDGRHVPRLFSLERNEFIGDFPAIALEQPMRPGDYLVALAVSPDAARTCW